MTSPTIVGAISDKTGSLRTGLQVSWAAIAASGLFWGAGYYFCAPLPTALTPKSGTSSKGPAACAPTFASILLGIEPEHDEENGIPDDSAKGYGTCKAGGFTS